MFTLRGLNVTPFQLLAPGNFHRVVRRNNDGLFACDMAFDEVPDLPAQPGNFTRSGQRASRRRGRDLARTLRLRRYPRRFAAAGIILGGFRVANFAGNGRP